MLTVVFLNLKGFNNCICVYVERSVFKM